MTAGKIQVKDIPDQAMIDLVDRLWNAPRAYMEGDNLVVFYPNGASTFDILKMWDSIPPKVIMAKLKKLVAANKLDGCTCGCRGEFTVVRADEKYLVEQYWEEAESVFKTRQVLKSGNRNRGQHG